MDEGCLRAGGCFRCRLCLRAGRRSRVRVCLRAGTSDRCAPPVLSLPPLRGRSLPFTKPRAATPSEGPARPAFLGRGTMPRSLGLEGLPCFGLLAASIRKSGLEIENRCTDCPCFDLLAALIRKFGLEIKNRCTVCPCFDLLSASIRKSGPEIKNHCCAIVPASRTARLQHSLPLRCCVRFQFSSSQSRTVPPAEGRYRYDAASDSNFRRSKVEQFRLRKDVAAK